MSISYLTAFFVVELLQAKIYFNKLICNTIRDKFVKYFKRGRNYTINFNISKSWQFIFFYF